ncbi:MAG: carboxypeptidase regulatory-like domain-containing protein [Gemmatimonadaceae bacterium]|nr:carboxypeptidase regulatory-like domain-containing protein [Gemmatimonadaceae bacterium]
MEVITRRASVSRRLTTAVVAVGALFTTACATDKSVAPPQLPGNSPVSQFKPMAFTADIDIRTGKVVIAAPTSAANQNAPTLALGGSEGPNLSLLGGEAVRLVPSNYTASAVGAVTPNKIRVTFDISIENKLPGVKFITPTWPVAPAAGVILFPLDYTVTTTPGGVTGGDGNVIIVEQPSYGGIEPSIDWNGTRAAGSGAPFNFFNDVNCALATSNDCFRWEAFDLEVLPLTGSTRQTIGFDIDASVAQFRTRMIVAADLAPAAAVPPGTIAGTVSSPSRGPLSGVTVTVSSGETAVTSATGTYSIGAVNAGSRTVTLSNLPSGCTAPSPLTVSVASGATATASFTAVVCTGLPGTISGTVISNQGSTPIAGATVSASNGGGTPVTAVTSATGTYTLANVASGAGTLTITALPTGCTAASPAYTLPSGGATTVNVTASCPVVVGPGFQYNTTWEVISPTQVAVTLRIDMRTFNRPDIIDYADPVNGVTSDPLTGAGLTVLYDNTKLTYVARTIPSGSAFTSNATINASVPGTLTIIAGGSDLISGNVGITRIIFNRVAGATGSVGTTTTISSAASRTGSTTVNITSSVVNVETPFTLP